MVPLTTLTVTVTVNTLKVLLLTVRRSGPARIGNVRDLFTTRVWRAREVKLLHSKSIERPIKRLHLLKQIHSDPKAGMFTAQTALGWARP